MISDLHIKLRGIALFDTFVKKIWHCLWFKPPSSKAHSLFLLSGSLNFVNDHHDKVQQQEFLLIITGHKI